MEEDRVPPGRLRYATCAQLVKAADARRLARVVARYGRLDLLLIDEVGYVQLDTRGAELLFQVLTERGGEVLHRAGQQPTRSMTAATRRASAMMPVTFNAHIIETGTESYRHRTSRTRRRSRRDD